MWQEDGRIRVGPHLLAAEGLVSTRLTDRYTPRFGAHVVMSVSVTTVVVLAWDR